MATLTVQSVDREDGAVPSYASAAGGGDEFANDGKVMVHVKAAGSGITLSAVIQETVDGEAVATKDFTVGAGGELMVGPFPTNIYNNANGRVELEYSAVTSVTVGCFRVTNAK